MRTTDRSPVVAWSLLGILVVTSALAVVASYASGLLALGVALAGVATALVLAWAAQAGATPEDRAAEPPHDERRPAA